MCIFSGKASVADTHLFARKTTNTRQVLVYQMAYGADADLAMILPIPIVGGTEPKFINMESYKEFFDDLAKAENHGSRGVFVSRSLGKGMLEIHEVGAYEASFVPDFASFERLDPRFKLKPGMLESVPGYDKFGFVVFKLKATKKPSQFTTRSMWNQEKNEKAHPMAFEFESSMPNVLFYPTIHIHDTELHDQEHFDHMIYGQGPNITVGWRIDEDVLRKYMKPDLTQGVIDLNESVYVQKIKGVQKNQDTVWNLEPVKVAA